MQGDSESVNKYIASGSDFCSYRKYVNCELSWLSLDPGEGGVVGRVIFVNGTVGG